MYNRLSEMEKRYGELEQKLADHGTISDKNQYQKLAKEFSDIGSIVSKYRQMRVLTRELAELEDLSKHIHDRNLLVWFYIKT